MKSSFLLTLLLGFACVSSAQIIKPKQLQPTVSQKRNSVQMHVLPNTSRLLTVEFSDFDYNAYRHQQDNLFATGLWDDFRQRLISIDSLLAFSKTYALTETQFDFGITYSGDGSIDTFTIQLVKTNWFSEPDNFDNVVQELNLTHIPYALGHAKFVDRQISSVQAMQIDYINSQLTNLQSKSGYDNNTYANALIRFIRQLLTDNTDQLRVKNNQVYEDSFEPAGLSLENKITMREKFIRYVYSKINS